MSSTNTKFTILYLIRNFFSNIKVRNSFLIISILGIIVFSNGLFNDFVGDDMSQIVNNEPIHNVKNILFFFKGSTFYSGQATYQSGVYYKPIMQTFYSFIYTIFGPRPFPFHFFQISLHIINTFLLYLLLTKFYKKQSSLIMSAVFLVHPINSEAVFYIAALQEILFFFFGITGTLLLIKNLKNNKSLFLPVFIFLIALLSKETAVLFLLLAVVYTFLYQRKRLLELLIYLSLLLLVYIPLRIHAVGLAINPHISPIEKLSLGQRLVNTPSIIFLYLKTSILPVNIINGYRWVYQTITLRGFILPLAFDLVFLGFILLACIVVHRKNTIEEFKTYLFFMGWFLIGLLFHIQIIPLDMTVAERWFYFPIAGILGLLPLLLRMIPFKLPKKTAYLLVTTILIALSTRTFVRSFNWRNSLTLKTHDIKVTKDYDYTAYNVIGGDLIQKGKYSQAKEYIDKSIAIFPNDTNYGLLGIIYVKQKKYNEAKQAFLKGLTYADSYLLYESLGQLGIVYGEPEENIIFIRKALEKFPNNSSLWLYLAILEYENENVQGARDAIIQSYKYDQNEKNTFVRNTILNNEELKINLN